MLLRRTHLALLAATLLVAAGCRSPLAPSLQTAALPSSRSAPSALPGSLDGEVRQGPASAIYDPGVDNTVPFPGVHVQILDARGGLVNEVVSAGDGTFSVQLPAGYYDLRPLWPATALHRDLTPPSDIGVTVYAGGSSPVALVYHIPIF